MPPSSSASTAKSSSSPGSFPSTRAVWKMPKLFSRGPPPSDEPLGLHPTIVLHFRFCFARTWQIAAQRLLLILQVPDAPARSVGSISLHTVMPTVLDFQAH